MLLQQFCHARQIEKKIHSIRFKFTIQKKWTHEKKMVAFSGMASKKFRRCFWPVPSDEQTATNDSHFSHSWNSVDIGLTHSRALCFDFILLQWHNIRSSDKYIEKLLTIETCVTCCRKHERKNLDNESALPWAKFYFCFTMWILITFLSRSRTVYLKWLKNILSQDLRHWFRWCIKMSQLKKMANNFTRISRKNKSLINFNNILLCFLSPLFLNRVHIRQRKLDVLELRPSIMRTLWKRSCITPFNIEYTA